jgi:hypothetical protein
LRIPAPAVALVCATTSSTPHRGSGHAHVARLRRTWHAICHRRGQHQRSARLRASSPTTSHSSLERAMRHAHAPWSWSSCRSSGRPWRPSTRDARPHPAPSTTESPSTMALACAVCAGPSLSDPTSADRRSVTRCCGVPASPELWSTRLRLGAVRRPTAIRDMAANSRPPSEPRADGVAGAARLDWTLLRVVRRQGHPDLDQAPPTCTASPMPLEGLRRHSDRGFTASTTGELLAAAAVPRARGATLERGRRAPLSRSFSTFSPSSTFSPRRGELRQRGLETSHTELTVLLELASAWPKGSISDKGSHAARSHRTAV